ncbi:hypothetical protein COX95_01645 [bacterium CG_4_10_14_0_2_um_filter_33_32]|nr:MAG: hypothetical protein AUJ93_03535 [bacterium CG2_30_33_46]PIR67935.1 MAG: hypothetical protein COU50_00730 [bacterium CG10_big_fil_rev_8_21_14_0_10_33_18]PIU76856.1 MAG: hypothetical protein COS74_01835 [bacterium CG06_land_8_20_14_3_00_33_50]PIW81558.1 MAG: hypothetical protein COZ97_01155 [bacterium CG_4_8_14_3_um_filter_33_28]PIY85389.1 MAG: hypothetical protein COY76_02430 [bacterium CG_4_10_14_0_8_um_filter_33_57]PIZ86332.1 MAG: hypothetical protein COX95_01645 [bacterium CG_4_10_1
MENKFKLIAGIIGGIIFVILAFFLIKVLIGKKIIEKINLTFWSYQDEEADLKPIIDTYTKKHPNISITLKKIENTPGEYEKMMTDAIASGEGPDILQIRNDWVPKHYKKITAVPSSTYSKGDFEKIFQKIANTDLIYNDKIYAIPFYVDTLAIFYNQKAMGDKVFEPSDTWENFKSSIKKIRNLKGDYINKAAIAIGTADNVEYSQDILYMLMLQNNTQMVSDDKGKAYFNISTKDKNGNIVYPGTSALEFYASFSDPTKETYTWRKGMPNSIEAFTSGKTAMMFGYAADIRRIKKLTNEKLKFEVATAPQILGNKVYYAKYWAYSVNKNSKNQKTAWDFLKFATTKEQYRKYIEKTSLPSSMIEFSESQGGKYAVIFNKQTKDAKTWFKGDWEKTDNAFSELINNITVNKQGPQDAINTASKKVTDILENMKENN